MNIECIDGREITKRFNEYTVSKKKKFLCEASNRDEMAFLARCHILDKFPVSINRIKTYQLRTEPTSYIVDIFSSLFSRSFIIEWKPPM